MAKGYSKSVKVINNGGSIGFTLFLSFIGAAIYFVEQSHGFWGFVWAICKAAVWPAYATHQAFVLMNV